MQLPFSDLKGSASRVAAVNVDANRSAVSSIIRRAGAIGMYRGLGVVLTGIIPKTAIRFSSFEAYKALLADKHTWLVSGPTVFAGVYWFPSSLSGAETQSESAADVSCVQKLDWLLV